MDDLLIHVYLFSVDFQHAYFVSPIQEDHTLDENE